MTKATSFANVGDIVKGHRSSDPAQPDRTTHADLLVHFAKSTNTRRFKAANQLNILAI